VVAGWRGEVTCLAAGTPRGEATVSLDMKGLLLLIAVVFGTPVGSTVVAQQTKEGSQRTHSERKYDFAIVNKDGGVSSWGTWMGNDWDRYQKRGPGIYVRKDGAVYEIKDAETLRKAEGELEAFKRVKDQFKVAKRSKTDVAREKEMQRRSKEHAELARKMSEEARALAAKMRDSKDPEAHAKFQEKMREMREQMKAAGKAHKDAWRGGEFGKEMAEFGRKMGEAAREVDQKMIRIIDEAFAKGLAKRI
jgi:hypothetical protein